MGRLALSAKKDEARFGCVSADAVLVAKWLPERHVATDENLMKFPDDDPFLDDLVEIWRHFRKPATGLLRPQRPLQ